MFHSKPTRRFVLQGAAASIAAMATRLGAQEVPPTFVYAGSYTARGAGIYIYRMNPTTGDLTLQKVVGDLLNPSFIALDPQQRYLYAVNEIGNYETRRSGSITAFSVDRATGDLKFINRQPTEGQNPAHVSVDPTGRFALVANYSGGNVTVLPIGRDGHLDPPSDVVNHQGALGPNTARQEAAHAHMILPDPTGRYVLANDLSLDKTFIYRLDGTSGKLTAGDPQFAQAAPGAGPRHLAFHQNGKLVLVLNELNSTLTSFTWDPQRGLMEPVQTTSTLPEGYLGVNTTAHVVIAASGRFAYASNRGHDSIAVFSLDPDTGRMQFIERVWSQGETPRNFNIDPSGMFMYVAHQNTDNIVTFKVDPATGKLTPTGKFTAAGQPVSIIFLTPTGAGHTVKDGVTFSASSNPVVVTDGSRAGQTTLSWHAPEATTVDIRVGSANGPSMGTHPAWGSATTGKWVADGMTFYLQDVSGGKALTAENTLGTVRVGVRSS